MRINPVILSAVIAAALTLAAWGCGPAPGGGGGGGNNNGGLFQPGVPLDRVEKVARLAWADGCRTGAVGGLIVGGVLGVAVARMLREQRQ